MFHYSVRKFGLKFFRNEKKGQKIKRPKFERPNLFASNVPNKVDSYCAVDDNDDGRVITACHQ